eukprot:5490046-Prymnesium_polylepis.1
MVRPNCSEQTDTCACIGVSCFVVPPVSALYRLVSLGVLYQAGGHGGACFSVTVRKHPTFASEKSELIHSLEMALALLADAALGVPTPTPTR